MYYSNTKLLSHNKLFNFVVGNRGGGKTFDQKNWAIRDFIKTGAQFILVRRYKTELDKVGTFFSDIAMHFPGHEFEVKGRQFFIDKKLAGWAVPLSTSQKEKSTAYPNVNKIIFDEFILDTGSTYHYLRNEVEVFLDFYETVARMRDVRVVFVSNAITMTNPYFIYFRISFRNGAKFCKGNGWVAELYKNDEFVERKKGTKFGQLIDNTRYGRYNIENEFLRDNNEFVEQQTGTLIYWCTIMYMGEDYGVWYNEGKGVVYVSRKVDKNALRRFCFTTEDHIPNVMLLKAIKSLTVIRRLRDAYEMSLVRFSDLKCKNAFYEYMNLI